MRGKRQQARWGKGSKLGGPCPKIRLTHDRLPIEPFPCMKSSVLGTLGMVYELPWWQMVYQKHANIVPLSQSIPVCLLHMNVCLCNILFTFFDLIPHFSIW